MSARRPAFAFTRNKYKIRHSDRVTAADEVSITVTLYSADSRPKPDGALEVAFELIQKGRRVLQIDGPGGFQMTGVAVHEAFTNRCP
jgi:hypothetical protein